MAGVRGRSRMVREVKMARGIVSCRGGSRHGVVPVRLLGEAVSVMA